MKKQQLAWEEEFDKVFKEYYLEDFVTFLKDKHSKMVKNDETFKYYIFKIILTYYFDEYPEYFKEFLKLKGFVEVE